jgi:signal transduction histidine kinase
MSGEWLPLSLDAEVAERLATIGQFSTLIAHEIRSPLTTIAGVLHHFQKLELPKASKVFRAADV